MRKLIGVPTLILVMALAGCHRQADKTRLQATEEEPPQLAGAVHMADARTATQLLKGFYSLEQNAWRWTAGKFAVRLRAPLAASQKGATLDLRFVAPEAVLAKLKTLTVSATVNGTAIPPQTFSKPGPAAYTHDVPASAFDEGDVATVEFSLDKTLPPGPGDARELGLVASSISLQAK